MKSRNSRDRAVPEFRGIRKIGGAASVFCDEAGFTGNNLLDSAQEVFVFAGVAMPGERAIEVVERTRRDFRLQGKELKGSRMLKTEAGRRAITAMLEGCAEQARLVSHLKKFALACKFFEYIFEPALAEQNSLFYSVGFHLFIGNLMFALLRTRDESAEVIFGEFSTFMREGKLEALEKIFPQPGNVEWTSNPLAAISLFAMTNRAALQSERERTHSATVLNWILDLTTTSLFSVLRYWGEVYDEIDVFCDKSKPLETEIDILKNMVGRRDHIRMQMFGKDTQFTFNLIREPSLVDSKDYAGVQIADVFSSAVASAWQKNYWQQADSTEKRWLDITLQCHLEDNVWPDLEKINLKTRSGFVNATILLELAQRSLKKENLFREMPEFIAICNLGFQDFLRTNRKQRRLK